MYLVRLDKYTQDVFEFIQQKLADRLIRYAVPTTESDKAVQVVVRVHYEEDYTQIILIIGGTMLGIVIFTIAFTVSYSLHSTTLTLFISI